MDDDDIEDLIMTPMVSNVYWDPFNHCLRMDPTLGSYKLIAYYI